MNLEVLKKTRDAIAADPDAGMTWFVHTCGTPSCIAGHAVVVDGWELNSSGTNVTKDGVKARTSTTAMDVLGLNHERLFFPEYWPKDAPKHESSRDEMLEILDDLIAGRRDPKTLELLGATT